MQTERRCDSNDYRPAHTDVWDIPVNQLPNKAAELWGELGRRDPAPVFDKAASAPQLTSTDHRSPNP
jgi:hypothetical protein